MSTTTADIAIIGGGIAGLSLAAAIGSRASVVVLEAEPELFHHTSSRSAQQMQPTYGPAPVRALTTASIPMVEAKADRAGRPIYVPRPLLWLHYGEERSHFEALLATVPGLARTSGRTRRCGLLPAAPPRARSSTRPSTPPRSRSTCPCCSPGTGRTRSRRARGSSPARG